MTRESTGRTGGHLTRGALLAAGLAIAAYGAWLLVHEQAAAAWQAAGLWLVAGVLAHDVVLSGLVLAGGAVVARVLPRAYAAPAAVGCLVLGSTTLMAVPVLGRFGALPDNPTLLDRPYATGWAVFAVTTVVLVVASGMVRAHRSGDRVGEDDG